MVYFFEGQILSILLFWQMTRVRYLISIQLRGGFFRFDSQVTSYLKHVPPLLKGYETVRGFMIRLTNVESVRQANKDNNYVTW